jgi:hypothetical protein
MIATAILLLFNTIPTGGENWGQTNLPFAVIMREHLWVLWAAAIPLAAAAMLARAQSPAKPHRAFACAAAFVTILLAFCAGTRFSGYLPVAWRVTSINANTPDFTALGQFAARLPANAVILVDEHERLENKLVEFATDRSCYAATKDTWPQLARQLTQAGADPYLLTPVALPLPVVFVDPNNSGTLYACSP